jgi:transcriptional regulator with XRE-family HTH domain
MLSSMAVRIRQSRSLALMTQGELANAVGVNRSAVAQWEREHGGTHPCVAHLAAIALATKVTFEWLATGRGLARCTADIAVPVVATAYTIDALEARCLEAVRRLPHQKRVMISTFIALLVG